MSPLRNSHGVSLVEVLIGATILDGTLAALSPVFPRAATHVLRNRQNVLAVHLADSRLESLKGVSYPHLATAEDTLGMNFSATCGCDTVDFALMPSQQSVISGVAYEVRSCVQLATPGAGGAWVPRCLAAGDPGTKEVVVQVSWSMGAQDDAIRRRTFVSQR